MAGTVHLSIDGAVATVTLDNAAKRNCVDLPLAAALTGAARAIAGDDRIGAVILRGAGERAFCAGGDFDAMTEGGQIVEAFARMETAIEEAVDALERIEVPIIAAIEGACFGAGVQVALAANIRLASDDARFGIPAATLGIVYPLSAIAEMIRAAGPGAISHFLLGAEPLDAAAGLARGLVERVFPKATLHQEAAALAQRIASHPRAAVRAYKSIIRGLARGRPMSEMLDIQRQAHEAPDLVERLRGVAAKRTKR